MHFLKSRFPGFFQLIFRLHDAIKKLPVRFQLSSLKKNGSGRAIAYLSLNFPNPPVLRIGFSHGGAVKLTYLAENFPHHFPAANLLYAVSSVAHPLQMEILAKAKNKKLKIIVNQNGVAFPAWDGANYQKTNQSLKAILDYSDYIIYQSQFCKDSAERYISPPNVPSEIIYNPVDTTHFSPRLDVEKTKDLTLLLGGNQYEKYRLELALRTLKVIHSEVPNAQLIVTGKLWHPCPEAELWTKQALKEMGLLDYVTFTGTYTQVEAPMLYSKAHVLLHTKYADPSPGLVLEALALGLPVVHLGNGGVPELVGDAGIGVPVEHDWDQINLPDPHDMANAVMQVYSRCEEFSQKARQRAVENFSLEKFTAKHAEIFDKVLDS